MPVVALVWQRQEECVLRLLLGHGAVVPKIWQPGTLCTRLPLWPPQRPTNPTLPPGNQPSWHVGLQPIFSSFVSLKPLEGPLGWEPGLLRAFLWPDLIRP